MVEKQIQNFKNICNDLYIAAFQKSLDLTSVSNTYPRKLFTYNICWRIHLFFTLIFHGKMKYKSSMGHIAHLRKHFKSINTYDYIITLIERRKKTHY